VRQQDVVLADLNGSLALTLGFSMQGGGVERSAYQPSGILGGLGVGVAQAHQCGNLLEAGRSWGLGLKSQRVIGGMPVLAAGVAPAIVALEIKGAKDRLDGTLTVAGFGAQPLVASWALEGNTGSPSLRGGGEDREHEFSRLRFQKFLQMAQGDVGLLEQGVEVGLGPLRPGSQQAFRDERGVDHVQIFNI
jgi:hypothetical protein